jgi:S1-C subfamily serine protease
VAVATPPAKTPAPSGGNSQPPKAGTTPAPAAAAKHGTATGTGMILTVNGHIVTNNHVVDACTELTVTRPGEPAVTATMVVRDEANDLALLKASIAIAEADVGRLRLGRPVPAGERIAVFGFPLSNALSSNGNIVEGNVAAVSGLGNDTASLQISAPVQPGNSGGPLLDFSPAIVGVVNATIDPITVAKLVGTLPQNVNFAIKANVLATFLESHSVPYEVAASAPQLDLVGVASAARKFTVLITCRY